jgi:O-antigen/teichoic acid export membrane protein
MVFLASLNVVESVLKLGIAIFVSYYGADKLVIYGLLMALVTVVLLAVRIAYCRKNYAEARIVPHLAPRGLLREMTSFAGWNFIGSAASMLANYGQGIVLNMFFGAVANAAQGVANQINGQISVLSRNMLQAVNPIIAKSEGAGSRGMMVEASIISSKYSYFLVMITCIPVITEMDALFSFWLKDVPPYAVIFTRLLLARVMIEQLFAPLSTSISAVGEIKNYQIVQSVTNVATIVAGYAAFRIGMGPVSIYYVFIAYAIVNAATSMLFADRLCGIGVSEFLSRVIRPAVMTTLVAILPVLIPYLIMDAGLVRLLVVFAVSLISSLAAILVIGMTRNERMFVVTTIHNLKSRIRGH